MRPRTAEWEVIHDDERGMEAGGGGPDPLLRPVELKVDGYDITLILERVGVYQNKIMVYIGGEFRGQWMAEDCDERRRFLQERKHSILSGKQMAEFERLPKQRQKELREKSPMQYSCFTPQWSSFRALKKHFCANNQSIELVKV